MTVDVDAAVNTQQGIVALVRSNVSKAVGELAQLACAIDGEGSGDTNRVCSLVANALERAATLGTAGYTGQAKQAVLDTLVEHTAVQKAFEEVLACQARLESAQLKNALVLAKAREATLRHLASLMRTDPIIHGCRQWQVVARPGYMAAQELLQQVKDSRLPSTSAVQGIPLDGSPTKHMTVNDLTKALHEQESKANWFETQAAGHAEQPNKIHGLTAELARGHPWDAETSCWCWEHDGKVWGPHTLNHARAHGFDPLSLVYHKDQPIWQFMLADLYNALENRRTLPEAFRQAVAEAQRKQAAPTSPRKWHAAAQPEPAPAANGAHERASRQSADGSSGQPWPSSETQRMQRMHEATVTALYRDLKVAVCKEANRHILLSVLPGCYAEWATQLDSRQSAQPPAAAKPDTGAAPLQAPQQATTVPPLPPRAPAPIATDSTGLQGRTVSPARAPFYVGLQPSPSRSSGASPGRASPRAPLFVGAEPGKGASRSSSPARGGHAGTTGMVRPSLLGGRQAAASGMPNGDASGTIHTAAATVRTHGLPFPTNASQSQGKAINPPTHKPTANARSTAGHTDTAASTQSPIKAEHNADAQPASNTTQRRWHVEPLKGRDARPSDGGRMRSQSPDGAKAALSPSKATQGQSRSHSRSPRGWGSGNGFSRSRGRSRSRSRNKSGARADRRTRSRSRSNSRPRGKSDRRVGRHMRSRSRSRSRVRDRADKRGDRRTRSSSRPRSPQRNMSGAHTDRHKRAHKRSRTPRRSKAGKRDARRTRSSSRSGSPLRKKSRKRPAQHSRSRSQSRSSPRNWSAREADRRTPPRSRSLSPVRRHSERKAPRGSRSRSRSSSPVHRQAARPAARSRSLSPLRKPAHKVAPQRSRSQSPQRDPPQHSPRQRSVSDSPPRSKAIAESGHSRSDDSRRPAGTLRGAEPPPPMEKMPCVSSPAPQQSPRADECKPIPLPPRPVPAAAVAGSEQTGELQCASDTLVADAAATSGPAGTQKGKGRQWKAVGAPTGGASQGTTGGQRSEAATVSAPAPKYPHAQAPPFAAEQSIDSSVSEQGRADRPDERLTQAAASEATEHTQSQRPDATTQQPLPIPPPPRLPPSTSVDIPAPTQAQQLQQPSQAGWPARATAQAGHVCLTQPGAGRSAAQVRAGGQGEAAQGSTQASAPCAPAAGAMQPASGCVAAPVPAPASAVAQPVGARVTDPVSAAQETCPQPTVVASAQAPAPGPSRGGGRGRGRSSRPPQTINASGSRAGTDSLLGGKMRGRGGQTQGRGGRGGGRGGAGAAEPSAVQAPRNEAWHSEAAGAKAGAPQAAQPEVQPVAQSASAPAAATAYASAPAAAAAVADAALQVAIETLVSQQPATGDRPVGTRVIPTALHYVSPIIVAQVPAVAVSEDSAVQNNSLAPQLADQVHPAVLQSAPVKEEPPPPPQPFLPQPPPLPPQPLPPAATPGAAVPPPQPSQPQPQRVESKQAKKKQAQLKQAQSKQPQPLAKQPAPQPKQPEPQQAQSKQLGPRQPQPQPPQSRQPEPQQPDAKPHAGSNTKASRGSGKTAPTSGQSAPHAAQQAADSASKQLPPRPKQAKSQTQSQSDQKGSQGVPAPGDELLFALDLPRLTRGNMQAMGIKSEGTLSGPPKQEPAPQQEASSKRARVPTKRFEPDEDTNTQPPKAPSRRAQSAPRSAPRSGGASSGSSAQPAVQPSPHTTPARDKPAAKAVQALGSAAKSSRDPSPAPPRTASRPPTSNKRKPAHTPAAPGTHTSQSNGITPPSVAPAVPGSVLKTLPRRSKFARAGTGSPPGLPLKLPGPTTCARLLPLDAIKVVKRHVVVPGHKFKGMGTNAGTGTDSGTEGPSSAARTAGLGGLGKVKTQSRSRGSALAGAKPGSATKGGVVSKLGAARDPGAASAGTAGAGSAEDTDQGLWKHITRGAKLLKFGRSKIQGWGMFATHVIEPEEFVIEYIGEMIRLSLADTRERVYQALGMDDYMFRVDGEWVVDATRKGGPARFINHCCDPNCYTKIITVDGVKHIAIYSKRRIEPGEELNYDYKFEIETDPTRKIPCNCGAAACRKWMC